MAEDINIGWEAPEFRHYPKNFAWYLTLFIIIGMIIMYLILQKDFFGAVTVAILTVFIVLFASQKPKNVQIGLSNKGLHIDSLHIPYKNIKHFWLVHNDNHKTLNMETTAYLNNMIVLELADQEPSEIREFLLEQLPENEGAAETLVQRIIHRFRF